MTQTPVDLAAVFGAWGESFLPRYLATLREQLPVEEVWIFGSGAQGGAKPGSPHSELIVDGVPFGPGEAESCARLD